jgi:hypothetical protein
VQVETLKMFEIATWQSCVSKQEMPMNRLLTTAMFALLVLSGSVQGQERKTFDYDGNGGGYFEFLGGNQWIEVTTDTTFNFKEVARTPTYVQLHDPSRKISVRLYDCRWYLTYPGSGGWRLASAGRWK